MPESESQINMAKLAMKIATIQHEIGQVKAEGKNDKYDFIGYEQVNAILRKKLFEHKVAIVPSFQKVEEREFTSYNKTVTRTIVYGKAMIIDGETGVIIEVDIAGADQDYAGKSFGQACTEAVKRFELKLFHVSTKADIDPDSKNDNPEPQPQPKRPPANKPQPQQDKFSERLMAEFNLDPDKVLLKFKEMKPAAQDVVSVDDLPGTTKAYISANLAKFQDCGLAQ
jgi:hypothetical protein